MPIKLYEAPKTEPVSLSEAKLHLKVDNTADDNLITALIVAAREYCESYQNRAHITQTWDLWLDDWPKESYINIQRPPLVSVAHIKYYDEDGTETTMSTSDYYVDAISEPGRVVLVADYWPTTELRAANGINVRFVAGYGAASAVPQAVKQAILLLIGHWYEQREAAGRDVSHEIAFAVKALLNLDRVVPV